MHETDMTKALIVTVRNWWNEQPEKPQIDRVHLTIGQFTCVEPVSLQFAFEVQTRGTFLEGAELVIAETPLIAFCHTCQQNYRPEIGIQYACPTCHAPMDDIRSGRELKIDRIEYAQSITSNPDTRHPTPDTRHPKCTKPLTPPWKSTCSTPTNKVQTTTAPTSTPGESPASTS